MRHPTKKLRLDGGTYHIDRDVAPLIKALHDLGIGTYSSCQGSCMGWCGRRHGRGKKVTYFNRVTKRWASYRPRIMPKRCLETVTIAFTTTAEATKFLNLVYRHRDPEKLRDRMRGTGSTRDNPWVWCPSIDGDIGCDLGPDWVTHRGSWVPIPKRPFKLSIGMLVLFPHSELAMVTGRVQAAL